MTLWRTPPQAAPTAPSRRCSRRQQTRLPTPSRVQPRVRLQRRRRRRASYRGACRARWRPPHTAQQPVEAPPWDHQEVILLNFWMAVAWRRRVQDKKKQSKHGRGRVLCASAGCMGMRWRRREVVCSDSCTRPRARVAWGDGSPALESERPERRSLRATAPRKVPRARRAPAAARHRVVPGRVRSRATGW